VIAMHPYRGHMPKPQPYAARVAGHVVRADSAEEFVTRLRRLGREIGFEVDVRDGRIALIVLGDETVLVERADPWSN
jgi:hypothetical protein